MGDRKRPVHESRANLGRGINSNNNLINLSVTEQTANEGVVVPVIDNPPSSGGSGRANWKRRVDTHVLPHGDIDAFCIIDVANISVEDR